MLDNDNLPKIDHNFSDLTADSLQQAWREENKQQRRRKYYWTFVIFLLAVVIGGLAIISWSTLRQGSSNWSRWIKDKSDQTLQGLKQWQANNERSVIEGDLLK